VYNSVVTNYEAGTESAVFPEPFHHQMQDFCGRKWGFWVVCSRNNIYLSGGSVQATLRNTAAAVIILLAAIIVGKGGAGSGTMG